MCIYITGTSTAAREGHLARPWVSVTFGPSNKTDLEIVIAICQDHSHRRLSRMGFEFDSLVVVALQRASYINYTQHGFRMAGKLTAVNIGVRSVLNK
jgi:hypothetical protein